MTTSRFYLQLSSQKCTRLILKQYLTKNAFRECSSASESTKLNENEENFRVLNIRGRKEEERSRKKMWIHQVFPPRTEQMPIDQDWTNVWPGPRTFHPAVVPLPLRQGINKLGVAPSKVANVELMKIPNFLHLTPPAIKKHCKALKKFCTPWPKGLSTDADCKRHFPLEVIQTDYCHSSPSIRDPLSRIVTIKFPLGRLELDDHAKDKFLRLVGERYDEESDIVTIVTDKCPLKRQNYDYAIYLLTALYFESWTYEPWEKEKTHEDTEYFVWDNSQTKENMKSLFNATFQNFDDNLPDIIEYKKCTAALFDDGENDYNWEKYNQISSKLLHPDDL